MTSRHIIRSSAACRKVNQVFRGNQRCTAAFHTCCSLKADGKDNEAFKKVESFDYMSQLKDFDSLKAFQAPQQEPRWKHEGNIIMVSLSCLLVYFMVLREENELDETMNQPLYTTIPALELVDLGTRIATLKRQGKDFSKEQERLEEVKRLIEEEEKGKK